MQTATNPQTGEKVQWNGSAWVPMGDSAPAPSGGPVTVGTPRPPKPEAAPSGYRWGVNGALEAIPGGPADRAAPGAKGPSGASLKVMGRAEGINLLEKQISDVEQLYQRDFKGGGIGAAVEYLPGSIRPENENFAVASRSLMGALAAAMGLTAQQQNTPAEVEMRFGPYIPKPGDRDEVIEGKLARLRDLLNSQKADIAAQSQALGIASPQDASAAPAEQMDRSTNLNEISAPPQEQLVPATNGYETVDNPELAGVRGEYLKRLEEGAGPGELIQFLRQAGITDPKLLQTAAKQAQYRRANPQVPIENYDTNALDDMDVPLSPVEGALNSAAQSAPGAYLMHAGQGVSMNTLDDLAPNPERARIALGDASNAHPIASMGGAISGGVMGALGAEGGLARLGIGAGMGRALAADTGYGAMAGAGASEGDRLGGALTGAAAGAGGSIAGRALTGGVASAVSPTGGRLASLYEAGVRPTPGQRALAASEGGGIRGVAGRALNAAEEGISSVPVVGAAVSGARQAARDQFQIGAFNEALKEIGEQLPKGMKAGTAPHRYAQQAFKKVYDEAKEGLTIRPDAEMAGEVQALSERLNTLAPKSRDRFESIMENVVLRRINDGTDAIAGPAYKQMDSELGKIIRSIRKNQSGDGELADVLEELSGTLSQAARRHSDPAAVELLDKADAGYAKLVRIEKAAAARGGNDGTFTPTQFSRSVQSESGGVRSKAFLRGDALMQDYADKGMSLVDRIPNSGSADRAMMGLTAAGGAGYIEPTSLGLLGTLGLLYAPGARKALTGAMAPRGPKAKAIANKVRSRKRIAAAGGATMAVQGTSPDQ